MQDKTYEFIVTVWEPQGGGPWKPGDIQTALWKSFPNLVNDGTTFAVTTFVRNPAQREPEPEKSRVQRLVEELDHLRGREDEVRRQILKEIG